MPVWKGMYMIDQTSNQPYTDSIIRSMRDAEFRAANMAAKLSQAYERRKKRDDFRTDAPGDIREDK